MFTNRKDFIGRLEVLKVPKIDVAAIANVAPPRVSAYVRYRALPSDQERRIEQAIEDIERVFVAFAPYRLDTSDPELFKRAIEDVDAAIQGLGKPKAIREDNHETVSCARMSEIRTAR